MDNDYNRSMNRGRSFGSGYLYSDQNQGGNYRNSQNNWDNGSTNDRGQSGYGNFNRRYGNSSIGNDDRQYANSSSYGNQGNWGMSSNNSQSNMRPDRNENNWDSSSNNQYGRSGESMGQHKGKGPKGYRRSDERIKEDISDRLSDDSYLDASDIEVKVENCDVVLNGTVDSREAKRHAENLAEAISGVKNVENRIRVKQTSTDAESSNSSSGGSSFLKSDNQNSKSDHSSKKPVSN
ncbi:MAG: BON domain-containing protein [Bacteroidetes bacterium]|nr:BON domain-containing protein [Bacteroidota bacterium]